MILLIDDLIATGGTADAAIELIKESGGEMVAAAFVVDLPDLGGSAAAQGQGRGWFTPCLEYEGD